jgi:crotonobetainyl-CoA:carnitine CoA-transferase CaiB-like acyl-CoA transferase
MTGLLDGMRVLDTSFWRPMAHATQILADLGAEVVMIEPPGGVPMRAYPQIFAGIARHKRSVELDLRTPSGRDRALELAARADVFCESWRPGVAHRLGLDDTAVRPRNPGIIYCSISGYGQTGPLRDVPGHDLNFQALGGALAPPVGGAAADVPPAVPRLPVADLEAGTVAATLVCAAWARRLRTGEGERIDVAMADVVAWWVGPFSTTEVSGSDQPAGGSPGYGVFATADDRWLALAPLSEPHLWSSICRALGLDALADVPFTERLARTAEMNDGVARAVSQLALDDALERLRAAGAPVSPVLTPEEMALHPQLAAREMVTTAAGADGAAIPAMALPAALDRHPRRTSGPIASVGEHPDGFSS